MTDNANDKGVYFTKEGLEELKLELKDLIENKRPSLIKRVADARQHGDLSENSEYTAARDELDFVNNRIDEVEDIMGKAQIIQNSSKSHKTVQLGTKLTVEVKGQKHDFTVVGEWEADPMEKKISHDSPLGKALLDKKVGEEVEIEAPAGKISYKIIKIH